MYIADGFYKYQTNYASSKISYGDLRNLSNYIVYKIKESNIYEITSSF
jgi:hypothetical protein